MGDEGGERRRPSLQGSAASLNPVLLINQVHRWNKIMKKRKRKGTDEMEKISRGLKEKKEVHLVRSNGA